MAQLVYNTSLNQTGISISDTTDEEIDGVPTTHYTLHRDYAKAAEAEPDPQLKQSLLDLARQGKTGSDLQLWVDQQNRPVRTLTVTSGGSTDSWNTDWDQNVHITRPPTEQIYNG